VATDAEWDRLPIQVIPKGTVLYYKGPISFRLLEDVTARGCWSIAEHDQIAADLARRFQANALLSDDEIRDRDAALLRSRQA
jgi:hypothetical protein